MILGGLIMHKTKQHKTYTYIIMWHNKQPHLAKNQQKLTACTAYPTFYSALSNGEGKDKTATIEQQTDIKRLK